MLTVPEDEDLFRMTSALNEGLQMTDDLTDHFFEVDHFMHSFPKLKYKMKAVIVTYKEVQRGKQKGQSNISSFKSLCLPLCHVLYIT